MPGSIKALRLYNLLLGGGLTGAQLGEELADPLSAGAFEAILRQRIVGASLRASPVAMTPIVGSPAALSAILRQNDGTWMTSIAASSSVMATMLASSSARAAFYNSDVALAAIAASATATTAMRSAPTYAFLSVTCISADTQVSIASVTGNCLMVGWSCSSLGNVTLTGRRIGSTVGSLVAASGTITGATAGFNNAMAITSPATVKVAEASRIVYFGIVPV